MKIAVCAKYVPDAAAHARIDPQSKRLDRSGEGGLNAFDANAVEEALKLKDAGGDEVEVVVVSLGPERALEAMRKALAMGADLAGRRADARGRESARQTADGVRLRRDRGAAPGGARRLGRDQRAALPVAEGNHGCEEEAAGHAFARRPRRGRR